MREYLIFQLYGPMASWGDIAVGETRPSALTPSRSAILGLIAASLGIKRPDTATDDAERKRLESLHNALEKGYGMALKTESLGVPLIDFHTAEVPKGKSFFTRREEILEAACQKRAGNFKGTILSRREYRQDAWYTCALWMRKDAPYKLQLLCDQLASPKFVLYLGRKSCPPALPLSPKVVAVEWVEDALKEYGISNTISLIWAGNQEAVRRLTVKLTGETGLITWDGDAETRLQPADTISRRDAILSRRRWQFAVRAEHRRQLSGEVGL